MIKDIYQLIRDLIDEAQKQRNLEFVDKLIEVKKAFSELQDENKELTDKLDMRNRIIRHEEGEYVTLNGDLANIFYCSTCWGQSSKLIQINKGTMKCPVCFNAFISATKGK